MPTPVFSHPNCTFNYCPHPEQCHKDCVNPREAAPDKEPPAPKVEDKQLDMKPASFACNVCAFDAGYETPCPNCRSIEFMGHPILGYEGK